MEAPESERRTPFYLAPLQSEYLRRQEVERQRQLQQQQPPGRAPVPPVPAPAPAPLPPVPTRPNENIFLSEADIVEIPHDEMVQLLAALSSFDRDTVFRQYPDLRQLYSIYFQ